jgi:hypothetical protein
MGKITGSFIRDATVAAVISTLGAVLVKYSDLPMRVSVVEQSQKDITQTVRSIDGKLDILIRRTK